MPNHIKNVVSFEGEQLKIKEAREFCGKTLDFEKLIPMPKELDGGKSPSDLPEAKKAELRKKYGAEDWYEWRLANWDTKWNGYQINEDNESDSSKCVFYTAWSMPEKIALALSARFPEVKVIWDYADEDIGYNCGEKIFKGGEKIDDRIGDEDFADELWGWQKNDDYSNPVKIVIEKLGDDEYKLTYDDESWEYTATKEEILNEISEHLDLVENF